MTAPQNGQQAMSVDPAAVIAALSSRIGALVVECAAKDAYIGQLHNALTLLAAETPNGATPEPEPVETTVP